MSEFNGRMELEDLIDRHNKHPLSKEDIINDIVSSTNMIISELGTIKRLCNENLSKGGASYVDVLEFALMMSSVKKEVGNRIIPRIKSYS